MYARGIEAVLRAECKKVEEGFSNNGELLEAACLAHGLDPYQTDYEQAVLLIKYDMQVMKWRQ